MKKQRISPQYWKNRTNRTKLNGKIIKPVVLSSCHFQEGLLRPFFRIEQMAGNRHFDLIGIMLPQRGDYFTVFFRNLFNDFFAEGPVFGEISYPLGMYTQGC